MPLYSRDMKLIMYFGADETIVTSLEKEHEMLKLYFQEGGRDLEEYDRREIKDGYCAVTYGVCATPDC